jgi:hypothetical protein
MPPDRWQTFFGAIVENEGPPAAVVRGGTSQQAGQDVAQELEPHFVWNL